MNSDSVVVDFNRIIITPGEFTLGKTEYITFPQGTFLDWDNNEHKGILTNTDWNFTITSDLKVNNLTFKNPITIYPNPTNGLVYIKTNPNFEIKNITIYNALGKIVLSKRIVGPDCCEFNLGHFSKGLYNIVLDVDGKILNERLLLE